MIKNVFVIFMLFVLSYSNNLVVVSPHSYYFKDDINKIYTKLLAYEETNQLLKIINNILDNSMLKNRIYFDEMGKVKVSTLTILQQLKYFLNGWPKYTNTYFNNNTDFAGIRKIIKDSIDNDSAFLNIPQNVISDIKKSIFNLGFFKKAQNLQQENNPNKIMKDLVLLMNLYYSSFCKLNIPLLKNFNPKIKNKLERDYRIYAKTSLIESIKIFKNVLNQNYSNVYGVN